MEEKLIALTFDDGPSDHTTGQVLDILERQGIKATFFLIGDNITEDRIPLIKRELSLGCDIENHSRTHCDMTTLSAEEIRDEIEYTTRRITEITGRKPQFFRPPYILTNDTMFDTIELPFICGCGCEDWVPEVPASERAKKVLDTARDGEIVLLHDLEGNINTVDALDTIIGGLRDQGFTFVTVAELFERKGVRPNPHSRVVFSYTDQAEDHLLDRGAFNTGSYRSVLEEAGLSREEIDRRTEEIFQTLFHGPDGVKLYHEVDDDMGWFEDTGNIDARTEGMSYAMMMCVQTDHQKEFDALWKWSKTYMFLTSGDNTGYFAWSCQPSGKHNAEGPAPDGEEYFAMALFFAAHRWGNREGIFNYEKEAQDILHACIHKGSDGIPGAPMWNNDNHYILFVPGCPFTDASYHLPHFYELFARWAYVEDRAFFAEAARASRRYLKIAVAQETGLYPEYGQFDGTPVHEVPFIDVPRDTYYSDAYRTIANIAMDSLWFGRSTWAQEEGEKLQHFFSTTGADYEKEVYGMDGKVVENPSEPMHPVAMIATNAEASILTGDTADSKACLDKFLNTPLREGVRRYYDNCLYFFAYLALGGNYRIY